MGEEITADDGLLELSDAIGLVRQQLVRAQLDGRTVVAGKVVTFAVGKVTLEFTGEIKSAVVDICGRGRWSRIRNLQASNVNISTSAHHNAGPCRDSDDVGAVTSEKGYVAAREPVIQTVRVGGTGLLPERAAGRLGCRPETMPLPGRSR